MKNCNFKKIVSTACMISFLSTSIAVAGPGDEQLDVPASSIRKGPSVGNVEKLTFENGQFTATVNGKNHTIKNYDVDKSIQGIITRNLLEEFLNADGKVIISQLETPELNEKEYKISEGGGLKGGMFFLPVLGAIAVRTVVQIGAKELAKMAAKKAAKAAVKKIGTKAAIAAPAVIFKGCKEYNKASKEHRKKKNNKKKNK